MTTRAGYPLRSAVSFGSGRVPRVRRPLSGANARPARSSTVKL